MGAKGIKVRAVSILPVCKRPRPAYGTHLTKLTQKNKTAKVDANRSGGKFKPSK